MNDYKNRKYLSSIEVAKYLDISVAVLHTLVQARKIKCFISTSGQKRFSLGDLKIYKQNYSNTQKPKNKEKIPQRNIIHINGTEQILYAKNAMDLSDLKDNSIHLMVTSPPYFNAKMYSKKSLKYDLGNIHNLKEWFDNIAIVWQEVFRVLCHGRKAFINIMNLPIRTEKGGFRTLNLVGKTIDIMEKIGFVFKRDIVWHKTNGVKAHFGTYPYPGGVLINNMHEFILEFNKPEKKTFNKYRHLTKEQKEESKLDKEFWLSIKNSDVWTMKPQNSGDNRHHIAPFPYELPYRIIKAFSYIGETVLDPFCGGGTSLKSAIDLKRNGIGYEIVPEIARETINNLKNHQSKLFV